MDKPLNDRQGQDDPAFFFPFHSDSVTNITMLEIFWVSL